MGVLWRFIVETSRFTGPLPLQRNVLPYTKHRALLCQTCYVRADLTRSKSGSVLIDFGHQDVTNQLSDDLVVVGYKTRRQLTKLETLYLYSRFTNNSQCLLLSH